MKWLINSGVFETGDYALDGLIRQRLFEYKHIINSPDLIRPYHRDLVQQLSRCSVARPCRMLISPITRLLYTIADSRRFWGCLSVFEGSVYFETPLVSKIGRASGRERVWQNVLFSVVAVELTKK